jgi:hypothetical protein
MTSMKTFLTTAAVALAFAAPVMAANTTEVKTDSTLEQNSNGGYDATSTAEKSTPAGSIKNKSETNLDVDSNGDTKKTTTNTHTNDPKGLMNKHTTKTKTVAKTTGNTTTVDHSKSVDGDTVQDSKSQTSY